MYIMKRYGNVPMFITENGNHTSVESFPISIFMHLVKFKEVFFKMKLKLFHCDPFRLRSKEWYKCIHK